jgi:hypothetical protein
VTGPRAFRPRLCPVDPAHGPALDWPTDRWGFHCPHRDHDGHGELAPSRAFFTTAEVEAGALRSPVETAPPAVAIDGRLERASKALGVGEAANGTVASPTTQPDPAPPRALDGDSSAADPGLERSPHPAAAPMPGQRGDDQLPLFGG